MIRERIEAQRGMFPYARSITYRMSRLLAVIIGCLLVPLMAGAQYAGGNGRGTVLNTLLPTDCSGEPGGAALPGTPCDDSDACTIDDLFTCTCVCAGTYSGDADSDEICDILDPCPGLPFLQDGDLCDDGDVCTADTVVNCVCVGTFQDGDGDGTCDANDPCAALAFLAPNDSCDDQNSCTIDDIVNENCACIGTSSTGGTILGNWLVADGLTYVFSTAYEPGAVYEWSILPDSTDWVLVPQDSTVIVTAPPINELVELCVTVLVDGDCFLQACTELFVMDVGVQEDPVSGPGFTIHPNPSNGLFELVRTDQRAGPASFVVADATGRTVLASGAANGQRTIIDLGKTSPGLYLLRLGDEQGIQVLRLLVQR